MTKNSLLFTLVIGLFILNGVLLFTLFQKEPGHPPPHKVTRPEKVLIDKLRLTDDQAIIYREMRQKHMAKNKGINKNLRESYDQLYDLLKEDIVNDEMKAELMLKVEHLTTQFNSSNFDHFTELKSILETHQLPLFNDFSDELKNHFFNSRSHPSPQQ